MINTNYVISTRKEMSSDQLIYLNTTLDCWRICHEIDYDLTRKDRTFPMMPIGTKTGK